VGAGAGGGCAGVACFFAGLNVVKTTAAATVKTTAIAKYKALSTAAAKCAAFGRDAVICGLRLEEQVRVTATARANTGISPLRSERCCCALLRSR
jgi:hypothetical protein